MSTDTPSPAAPAPTDRGERMSTPTPEGQYYVHSTAHPIVGGPVSHDEAIAALGALDNAYVQSPAASARRRDTPDVIERARCVLAESYDGIDPDVETRHDGAVANLAAAGLLAVSPPADAIERARHIIADHCFGPHATPAAEERALDIASACTDDMADQGLLALAASPAAPQARERGELWNVLDWSLWGNGMADTFRDPLADKMIAALTDAEYEQATALIERWRRLRGDQAYRKLYEDQRAEIGRLKALSAPAPADDEAALVERMAAAIAKDDGFDWRSGEWNDVYLSRARAALAALKEGAEGMTTTYTRTHVYVTFADPYLACEECGQFVTGYHDNERCGCDAGHWLQPCDHMAGATSVCPSWSPVDGCQCLAHLGKVDHDEPPTEAGQ